MKTKSRAIACLISFLFIFSNGSSFTQIGGSDATILNNQLISPKIEPAVTRSVTTTFNSFPVGAGGSDVIPHQIVRTKTDKIYMFGYKGEFSNLINAYWSNTAGLPTSSTTFSSTSVSETSYPLSVEVAYDGGDIIHVLDNTIDGNLNDNIFDITTNTFKAKIPIATGNPTVSGEYVGTSGLSAMVGADQVLHLAFWSSGGNITYREYTYNNTNSSLTLVTGSAQQLDNSGKANHPSLAISPVNGAVTVAWVSESTTPARILAATRTSGFWGGVEQVNTAAPWTSVSSGINIDQGPSLVIDSIGTRHLTYIQNYDQTNDYGRIHYVTNRGSGWTDNTLAAYTHDPAVAINNLGEVYIIGHGHPSNVSCTSNLDMCISKKNPDNSWASPVLFAQHSGNDSFDTSPSVKWSVVGYNRPETIEFIFPLALNLNYSTTTLYYGNVLSNATPPTATPTATPTPTISPTFTPIPTATPIPPSPLVVTNINDNGNINLEGTLSYALDKAVSGQTISFNLTSGSTVTITVMIPVLKTGVRLRYQDANPGANCSQPITLSSPMVPGGANLRLGGQNIIEGLIISTFQPGPGIINLGTNNKIRCTRVKM